jgi:hypothetical protein
LGAANVFVGLGLLQRLWNPFLSGLAQFNGHAAEGFGTLVSEWQNFVTLRLKQYMQLVQHSRRVDLPVR